MKGRGVRVTKRAAHRQVEQPDFVLFFFFILVVVSLSSLLSLSSSGIGGDAVPMFGSNCAAGLPLVADSRGDGTAFTEVPLKLLSKLLVLIEGCSDAQSACMDDLV